MNILTFVTFYLIKAQAHCAKCDYEIAESLQYVIEKFFRQRSSSITLILSCDREDTMNFYSDLDRILFSFAGNIKTQIVVNGKASSLAPGGGRISNLLLVDSVDSFLKIDLASMVQHYDDSEYYYIVLHNDDRYQFTHIQRILDYCWANFIINVNVQVQRASGEIIVYTYFPFTESSCGKVIPVVINSYQNGVMKTDDLFPQKLLNMYSCPLRVATWNVPPFILLNFSKSGGNTIDGFEGELLKQLSVLMNFTIEIVVPPNKETRGTIIGNHSTGAIGMLRRKEADLSIGCFYFTKERSQVLTASICYFQATNVAILSTNSKNYTPTRALWFPFNGVALESLLASFVINLGLLYGLAHLANKWPAFISVAGNRNICLNLIACTLSLPALTQPKRNSGRIFIMAWMLYTLVIRTMYQAFIYHLIRNNLFRKTPSTIEDIVKLDYSFALQRITYTALQNTTIFTDTGLRWFIVDETHFRGIFAYLEDNSHDKLVTIAPLEFLQYYMANNRKAGVLTTLKENFMVYNACIYFTKHSFLADRINFLVQRIYAVGLMDAWVKKTIDLSYLRLRAPPVEVIIGQMELKGIYYVCGMMLAGSVVVFGLEIISLKFKFLRCVFEKL